MLALWTVFLTLKRFKIYADGNNVMMRETSCLSPELHHGVDEGTAFPTFKTDAITKIDSHSRCTSTPEFSFSFSSLQDFTLADCLKMPFVRGPFWLRKKSISYREAKGKIQNGTSHIQAREHILALLSGQMPGVPGDWGPGGSAGKTKVSLFWVPLNLFSLIYSLIYQHLKHFTLNTLIYEIVLFNEPTATLKCNFLTASRSLLMQLCPTSWFFSSSPTWALVPKYGNILAKLILYLSSFLCTFILHSTSCPSLFCSLKNDRLQEVFSIPFHPILISLSFCFLSSDLQ